MKNKIVLLLVIIISSLFIVNVYAKKDDDVDFDISFKAKINFVGKDKTAGQSYSPDNYKNYVRNIITFSGGGVSGQAFCVYPGFNAATVNDVTCTVADPYQFPLTYWIVYNHWDELKNNGRLADYTLRAAGMIDVQTIDQRSVWYQCDNECNSNVYSYNAETVRTRVPEKYQEYLADMANHPEYDQRDICIRSCQYVNDSKDAGYNGTYPSPATQFIVSFQNALGQMNDPNRAPDIFKDRSNEKIVETGNQFFVEANNNKHTVETQWKKPAGTAIAGNDIILTGKFFKVTDVTPLSYETKKGVYKIESLDGSYYPAIRITPVKGSYKDINPWNGHEAIIEVTATPKCEAEIMIDTNASTSGEDNPPPPTPSCPDPKKRKTCYKKKEEKVKCCARSCHGSKESATTTCDPYHVTNTQYPQCASLTDSACQENPNRYASTGRYVADGSNVKTCQETCPPGYYERSQFPMTVSASGEKYDVINADYATEPDELILDGYVGVEEDENINNYNKLVTPQEKDNITVYYCQIQGQQAQSYVAIVDEESRVDDFTLSVNCDNCDEGDCTPVEHFGKIAYADLHNCCEDGQQSMVAQVSLKELFCTDNGTKAKIKENCNANEYVDKTFNSNKYCKQYCSNTIMYNIPGPTYANANGYFKFDGSPFFRQFKRCRTVIRYDQFNSEYKDTVEGMIVNYNNYQKEESHAKLWEALKKDPTSENISKSVSCYTKQDIEYDTYSEGACDKWKCKYPNFGWQTCDGDDPTALATECTHHKTDTTHHSETNTIATKTETRSQDVTTYKETDKSSSYTYSTFGLSGYNWSAAATGSGSHKDSTTYYDRSSWDSFISKFTSSGGAIDVARSNAEKEKTGKCSSGSNCSVKNEYVTCDSAPGEDGRAIINPDDKINGYRGEANKQSGYYAAGVNSLKENQRIFEECGGRIDNSNGHVDQSSLVTDKGVLSRIKIQSEPELEVTYSTLSYDSDEKAFVSQILKVPFAYVDYKDNHKMPTTPGQRCVYEQDSPMKDEDHLDEFGNTELTRWLDNTYSESDGNQHIFNFQNYKGTISYDLNDFTGFSGGYLADRKYTTDAVSMMTCKWLSDPGLKYYTLIPNGNILNSVPKEESGIFDRNNFDYNYDETQDYFDTVIKDGDVVYTQHTGIVSERLTTLSGKYEIFYTLKHINELESGALFDNAIHEQKGCTGTVDKTNGSPTNAACYFYVVKPGQDIFNCSPERKQKDDGCWDCYCKYKTTGETIPPTSGKCGEKCDPPSSTIDYKEVDPDDMFPFYNDRVTFDSEGKPTNGYAYNWRTDPTGLKSYNKYVEMAKEDSVYARENLTYSFTLTPNAIKQIRAYNKARLSEGGYKDFQMVCSNKGSSNPQSSGAQVKRCYSKFLTAISGGETINYGTGKLEMNVSNVNINKVRESLEW